MDHTIVRCRQVERTEDPGFIYTFHGGFEVETHRLTSGIFPVVVGLDVVASNRDASSLADFFGTVRLSAATDGAGSPVPLSSLGFDSGLVPVPEPATWAMLLAGLAFVTAAAMLRRREI